MPIGKAVGNCLLITYIKDYFRIFLIQQKSIARENMGLRRTVSIKMLEWAMGVEPTTLLFLGLGLIGLAGVRGKFKN
jgi:hypothetical protein